MKNKFVEEILTENNLIAQDDGRRLILYYVLQANRTPHCYLRAGRVEDIIKELTLYKNYRYRPWAKDEEQGLRAYQYTMRDELTLNPVYDKIDVEKVDKLWDKHTDWGSFRLALTKLILSKGAKIDRKLKKILTDTESYREALMSGKNAYRLLGYPGTAGGNGGAVEDKNFDSETDTLRYVLENLCSDQGFIVGDRNIAKFIENNGDKFFKQIINRRLRSQYLKNIKELIQQERFILPAAIKALEKSGREKN